MRVNKLHGSGPVAGVIEVSPRVQSIKAFLNYYPRYGSIEFIFDPESHSLIVGKVKYPTSGSPHQQLARSINANESVVVGGMLQKDCEGHVTTNEMSGHFWQNWTPAVREQLVKDLAKFGVTLKHSPL